MRIPSSYVRQIGLKDGDQLQAHLGADVALNLRPAEWSRIGWSAFCGLCHALAV